MQSVGVAEEDAEDGGKMETNREEKSKHFLE